MHNILEFITYSYQNRYNFRTDSFLFVLHCFPDLNRSKNQDVELKMNRISSVGALKSTLAVGLSTNKWASAAVEKLRTIEGIARVIDWNWAHFSIIKLRKGNATQVYLIEETCESRTESVHVKQPFDSDYMNKISGVCETGWNGPSWPEEKRTNWPWKRKNEIRMKNQCCLLLHCEWKRWSRIEKDPRKYERMKRTMHWNIKFVEELNRNTWCAVEWPLRANTMRNWGRSEWDSSKIEATVWGQWAVRVCCFGS